MKGIKGRVNVGVDDSLRWGVNIGFGTGVYIAGGISFGTDDEYNMVSLD